MIIDHPVAQTFHNHVAHVGVVAVQRIAAPAEVIIMTVWRKHVIGLIVDAAIRDVGSLFVAFGGVVKHHVENHLNTVLMQLLHQVFQLIDLHGIFSRRGIGSFGSKESHVAVAPQVIELPTIDWGYTMVLKLVELMDRHQLHTVDAQFKQIRNLLDDTSKRSSVLHARACSTREVTHVHLIDDKVIDGRLQREIILPVEIVEYHACTILVGTVPMRFLSPHVAPHDEFRIGIEQDLRPIKPVTLFRFIRTIHPETVFYILIIQIEDNHREHITQSELLEERYFHKGFLLAIMEEHQRTVSGIT